MVHRFIFLYHKYWKGFKIDLLEVVLYSKYRRYTE